MLKPPFYKVTRNLGYEPPTSSVTSSEPLTPAMTLFPDEVTSEVLGLGLQHVGPGDAAQPPTRTLAVSERVASLHLSGWVLRPALHAHEPHSNMVGGQQGQQSD